MRREWIIVVVAALALAKAHAAFADPVDPGHLKIELAAKKSRKLPAGKKQRVAYETQWKKACNQLGKALEVGKGPWGYGAFSSFSCYRDARRVAGKDADPSWTLTVIDGVKQASFTLVRNDHDGKTTEISGIALPGNEFTLEFFSDQEFTDLVAFQILDGMPFAMRLTKAMIKGSPPTFSGRHWRSGQSRDFKFEVPPAPETLTLFRVEWDPEENVYRSEVIGTAKRATLERPKLREKGQTTVLRGGRVTYETSQAVVAALASGGVWAHDVQGPQGRGPELSESLKSAHDKLAAMAESGKLGDYLKGRLVGVLTALQESASSGYVGIRYGIPVLSEEALLAKTKVFGLIAEFRGGFANGLRYYYDHLPRTSLDQEGPNGTTINTNITWSRHVVGYSWEFDPGFLIDRVTIDPKLGMWDFDGTLPTSRDEQGLLVRAETFQLFQTFSTALEVGLELREDWYTLRGWYAIDTGTAFGRNGGTVTSNRCGVDTYLTAGPEFSILNVQFRTAVLGFFVFEAVTLAKNGKIAPAAGEEKITDVKYSGSYAGGGVALSW